MLSGRSGGVRAKLLARGGGETIFSIVSGCVHNIKSCLRKRARRQGVPGKVLFGVALLGGAPVGVTASVDARSECAYCTRFLE